jgi:hypothetical protein
MTVFEESDAYIVLTIVQTMVTINKIYLFVKCQYMSMSLRDNDRL